MYRAGLYDEKGAAYPPNQPCGLYLLCRLWLSVRTQAMACDHPQCHHLRDTGVLLTEITR